MEQTVLSVSTDLPDGQKHPISKAALLSLAGFSCARVASLSKARCRRDIHGLIDLDFELQPVDAVRVGSYYLVCYARGWTREEEYAYWQLYDGAAAADYAQAMWEKA